LAAAAVSAAPWTCELGVREFGSDLGGDFDGRALSRPGGDLGGSTHRRAPATGPRRPAGRLDSARRSGGDPELGDCHRGPSSPASTRSSSSPRHRSRPRPRPPASRLPPPPRRSSATGTLRGAPPFDAGVRTVQHRRGRHGSAGRSGEPSRFRQADRERW
jgi:hypothetical protein